MSGLRFRATAPTEPFGDLAGILRDLTAVRERVARVPVADLVGLFADFGQRLLRDPETRGLEGAVFLSAWLRRGNLEAMLDLNLGGRVAALDGFVDHGGARVAARPHGLVAMWMAGNVPTLPMFSLVPAMLAKNVCLVKLAGDDPQGMDALLGVLAASGSGAASGEELAEALAVVAYSSSEIALGSEMSMAADAKVVWGGRAAIEGVRALPQQPHCINVEFGPKYSIGVVDRQLLDDEERLDDAIAAFVRDIAIFDQRACSSPQTIFVERGALTLRDVGLRVAAAFAKLPAKPGLDAYTTVRILNARAEWALADDRDVLASSDGANWTVCLDRDLSLKEAVQSRTVFLTAIDDCDAVLGLLSPRVQTIGIAFGDSGRAERFAEAATLAGVVRCVRPGLMNVQESPWDGKLLIGQLVRWVTLKS